MFTFAVKVQTARAVSVFLDPIRSLDSRIGDVAVAIGVGVAVPHGMAKA